MKKRTIHPFGSEVEGLEIRNVEKKHLRLYIGCIFTHSFEQGKHQISIKPCSRNTYKKFENQIPKEVYTEKQNIPCITDGYPY